MPVAEDHDVQLIHRIASGDRSMFAELFDRHSPVVLGVLMKMLGRRDLAEEILQDAFLQAWNEASRYRPERGSVRGWLLMIARSRAIDILRSNRSRSQREKLISDPNSVEEPIGPIELEQKQDRARVLDALQALSPEQRQCIQLAFWDGLTHRQVAQQLDQPLGTVKSRILLGMNKLRDALST